MARSFEFRRCIAPSDSRRTFTNRFWNGPSDIGGTLVWDFVHLYRSIQEGILLAKKEFGDGLVSMGIDTWGVDFGLIDADGKLLGNPVNYRDSRTDGMMDKVFACVPKREVYDCTGIQFMQINSLYQMMSLSLDESVQYRNAAKLLFVPDLLNYWLTGKMVAERTDLQYQLLGRVRTNWDNVSHG